MAKYDSNLGSLKEQLSGAKNILVALPAQVNPDKLAAGLSLFLSLKNAGKEVSIISEDTLLVSHTNLFGVGQVQNSLPKGSGGDLILTLEGVVAADGQVPGLEKLDWYPEGANLNLVFHTIAGQKFEPTKITPVSRSGGFDLIFCMGASSLDALGNLYKNSQESFSGTITNIDNEAGNSHFGAVNIVDPSASSISEIIAQTLPSLGLNIDSDIASNILVGIYDATTNLTNRTNPDTFLAVGFCMQAGGKNPLAQSDQVAIHGSSPEQPVNVPSSDVSQNEFPPLNQVFGFPAPSGVQSNEFTVPSVINQNEQVSQPTQAPSSSEERPQGEAALESNTESNPDPAWLSPKVFSVNKQ